MRALVTTALALLGPAAMCAAQVDGQATWLWEVMTEDGDDVVEPGETATVTLSIDMEPDVNFPDGPVIGFAATTFNTIGGGGASNGQVLGWQLLSGLDWSGDSTTTDGVSLYDTSPFQHPFVGPAFIESDPIDILQFTWGPNNYAPYSVEYSTESFGSGNEAHVILVWEGSFLGDVDAFEWPVREAAISFQVVPVPGMVAFVVGCAAWVGRRRVRSL